MEDESVTTGHLQKRQEAQVYEMLEAFGFDPADFTWDRPPEQRIDNLEALAKAMPTTDPEQTLTHDASGYYFIFTLHKNESPYSNDNYSHAVEFAPTEDYPDEEQTGLDWANVVFFLDKWLRALREELKAENPWGQLRAGQEQLEDWDAEKPGSEPFTPEERQRLEEGLDEFEQRVKDRFDLQQEQIDTLEQLVQDLKDQLDTVKRRQWQTSAIGFIVRVGFSVGFSDTDFGEAFRFFEDFLDNLPRLTSAS